MGFFHRSNRTVHEQILFRLKSRSKPAQYYDIIEGEFRLRSSSEIREEIISATQALGKLGVGPGDRVALVGFNSTHYLTLDVAIGLVGGISVPIYYTSSIEEIKEIVEDCDANLLFVGTPDILGKLKDLDAEVDIVSFTRESEELPTGVMGWDEFRALGGEITEENISAPVDFSDIATIRYTSGTTGKPRGVIFTHGNLRWMAEYIASMPPWKDRNSEANYLSILPMNHVVEGILGLYGPYYAPASLKLYFLENFHELQEVLPKVRPNIFFSVPRFYEKVWSSVLESGIGPNYIKSGEGLKKQILRRLIKRAILKRTGLDRCAQLIVGSAPMSEDLLKAYQELGIEIHNAYGLTEAPLVTINRLSANKTNTVGEPLPSTRLQIAPDGEIMVKGPQVMSGYFNQDLNDTPCKDGWLLTGDFGYLTGECSLVITGRKKELMVNSYGKTISPLKIECMLRDIPGVSEALLIGEEKPYVSSLLWFDEEPIQMEIQIKNIYDAVREINSRVSRPEEIRKWVMLKNDLSIEQGDLTANLKLKRENIVKRYKRVINFIYDESEYPEGILRLGNMGDINVEHKES